MLPIHAGLWLQRSHTGTSMVMHTCNHSSQETEAEASQVWVQPGLLFTPNPHMTSGPPAKVPMRISIRFSRSLTCAPHHIVCSPFGLPWPSPLLLLGGWTWTSQGPCKNLSLLTLLKTLSMLSVHSPSHPRP